MSCTMTQGWPPLRVCLHFSQKSFCTYPHRKSSCWYETCCKKHAASLSPHTVPCSWRGKWTCSTLLTLTGIPPYMPVNTFSLDSTELAVYSDVIIISSLSLIHWSLLFSFPSRPEEFTPQQLDSMSENQKHVWSSHVSTFLCGLFDSHGLFSLFP